MITAVFFGVVFTQRSAFAQEVEDVVFWSKIMLAVVAGLLLGLAGIEGWYERVGLSFLTLSNPFNRKGFVLFAGAVALATVIALKATGWVSEDMLGASSSSRRLTLNGRANVVVLLLFL
jgi:hypothetical protein